MLILASQINWPLISKGIRKQMLASSFVLIRVPKLPTLFKDRPMADAFNIPNATDIPVYFFGLYLFLSPNGLIHCFKFLYPNCFWKCQFVMMSTEIRISRLIVYFLCFVNNHRCQSFCWALTAVKIGIFKNNSGTKICRQWIKPFGDRNR